MQQTSLHVSAVISAHRPDNVSSRTDSSQHQRQESMKRNHRRQAVVPGCLNDSLYADLRKHHRKRSTHIDHGIPLTWMRCLLGCFSYMLVLSDVPRTGMAIASLDQYPSVEPNNYFSFGPYWYPYAKASNEEINATLPLWGYKYDTTSIGLRSFGEYFKLSAFPDCVLYRQNCESKQLPSTTVFNMLDAIVCAVASRSRTGHDPAAITLRSQHEWFDHLHHHLLPQVFNKPIWRTNQALHYPVSMFNLNQSVNFCATDITVRPYSCDDLWVNIRRSFCGSANICHEYGALWHDILNRIFVLQAIYPHHQVDLTIVESTEDAAVNKGGVSFYSRRMFDIVTIMRVRHCSAANIPRCTTIFIDDHRYEGIIFATDITNWYWLTATFRCLGQGYMCLRAVALLFGCFIIRSVEEKYVNTSFLTRAHVAIVTLAKIPTQVIIYGSYFPLVCYVIAHIIDAPMVYEMITHRFITTEGILHISLREFIEIASIRMRSVWLIALAVHIEAYLRSKQSQWIAPISGITGVREFSITAMSAITVFAQYRSTKFRSTKVLSVSEVVRRPHLMPTRLFDPRTNGIGNELWEGILLDLKCILCIVVVLVLASSIYRGFRAVYSWYHPEAIWNKTLIIKNSLAPYSSGILWPASGLSVAWDEEFIIDADKISVSVKRRSWKSGIIFPLTALSSQNKTIPRLSFYLNALAIGSGGRNMSTVSPSPRIPARQPPPLDKQDSASMLTESEREILQRNLERLLERRPEVESLVVLMNVAMMTDPFTFLQLYVFGGHDICWFQSRNTAQIFLIPKMIVKSKPNIWVAWEELDLLYIGNTKDMKWTDLVLCG